MSEKPIFRLRRINGLQFDAQITHMVVCNEWMYVVLRTKVVVVIDMNGQEDQREFPIEKASEDDLVHNVFLDPSGRHFIVSMQSGDNFYLSRAGTRFRTMDKAKNHLIESVGWNRINASDTTTGSVLIGTNSGLIFETVLEDVKQKIKPQTSAQVFWKQVFVLDKPINGIDWGRMDQKNEYFVIVAMPSRVQQYLGSIPKDSEAPIFGPFFANKEGDTNYLYRSDSLGYSYLRLYYPPGETKPDSMTWMSATGVFHAGLDLSTQKRKPIITLRTRCLNFPADVKASKRILGASDKSLPVGMPIGMEMTEFHILLLYSNTLTAMSNLDNDPVAVDLGNAESHGEFKSLCRDSVGNRIWGFSTKGVFRIDVNNETRHVKDIYMKLGMFDFALKFAGPDEEKDVKLREAEFYYGRGELVQFLFTAERHSSVSVFRIFTCDVLTKAAELFAATDLGFQQAALKFIDSENEEPLRCFLWCRLMLLASGFYGKSSDVSDTQRKQAEGQMAVFCLWILEIYLNQLGKLRDAGENSSTEHQNLAVRFYEFLSTDLVKETLKTRKEVAYKLIESHGNVEDMAKFAALMSDYEKLIKYQIRNGLYKRALRTITELAKPNIVNMLHYNYGGVLIRQIPDATLKAWKAQENRLYPAFLLPCLMQAKPEYAIDYLEFAVGPSMNCREQDIHNFLVSLYAKTAPAKLISYLEKHGKENVPYDPQSALRICRENKQDRASIHLCRMLNLWDEAVDLALSISPILAKEIASSPTIDNDLKKKLWLKIARYVVDEEKDIQRAMALVDECNLLKIEDILPFFPDFETIDHFKDAICKSLDTYNTHIEELKNDMDTATRNAEVIHDEMRAFRCRYQVIRSDETCAKCKLPLLWRTFYLFPCRHAFHTDCLVTTVKPFLAPELRSRFESLSDTVLPSGDPLGSVHQFRTGYEELIAADCPFCGQYAIDSVNQPLFDPSNYAQEMNEWRV